MTQILEGGLVAVPTRSLGGSRSNDRLLRIFLIKGNLGNAQGVELQLSNTWRSRFPQARWLGACNREAAKTGVSQPVLQD